VTTVNEPVPDFDLTSLGSGHYQLSGELSFATAERAFYKASELSAEEELTLDLSELSRIDSAGLAVLVEWWRKLHESNIRLRLLAVPDQLSRMIAISGLEPILLADG